MENERKGGCRGSWMMFAGVLLIVSGVMLLLCNWYEGQMAFVKANALVEEFQTRIGDSLDDRPDGCDPFVTGFYYRTGSGGDDSEVMSREIKGYPCMGLLSIPRLDLVLPVISEYDDERLDAGLCRYYGSQEGGNLVIAGHNYAGFFKNLNKIQQGDQVIFTDIYGIETIYQAGWTELIDADEVEKMIRGNWDLTLFTCTYGAKARVTLRCFKNDK